MSAWYFRANDKIKLGFPEILSSMGARTLRCCFSFVTHQTWEGRSAEGGASVAILSHHDSVLLYHWSHSAISMDAFEGHDIAEAHTEKMQSMQVLQSARESSQRIMQRAKSELTKLSSFVPTSIRSSVAASSVSKDTSLALKDVSSRALAESAEIARQQQQEVLTKLLQGSARILTINYLPVANEIVDSWIQIAKAHRDGLMQAVATESSLETPPQSSASVGDEVAETSTSEGALP